MDFTLLSHINMEVIYDLLKKTCILGLFCNLKTKNVYLIKTAALRIVELNSCNKISLKRDSRY